MSFLPREVLSGRYIRGPKATRGVTFWTGTNIGEKRNVLAVQRILMCNGGIEVEKHAGLKV